MNIMPDGLNNGLKIYSGCVFDKDANGYLDTAELYELYNGVGIEPTFQDPVSYPDRSEQSGAASKDATLEVFNNAIYSGQSEYEVMTTFLGLRDNVRTKLKLLIEYGFIATKDVPDWMLEHLYIC